MKRLTICLCALLAGCGVEEHRLEDGTRCVTMQGWYASGIDCDWSKPNE